MKWCLPLDCLLSLGKSKQLSEGPGLHYVSRTLLWLVTQHFFFHLTYFGFPLLFLFFFILYYRITDLCFFNFFLFCDPIRDPVLDPVRDQVRDPVGDPVRDPVGGPVRDPVRGPVRGPLRDPVLVLSTPTWAGIFNPRSGQLDNMINGKRRSESRRAKTLYYLKTF